MGWYQCSCGLLAEETPTAGDTLVSVYHLHRSARVDGSGAIVRMEEIPDPRPAPGASPEGRGALNGIR